MRDLDETDMEILSLLAENARRSFSAIGEEVGLGTSPSQIASHGSKRRNHQPLHYQCRP